METVEFCGGVGFDDDVDNFDYIFVDQLFEDVYLADGCDGNAVGEVGGYLFQCVCFVFVVGKVDLSVCAFTDFVFDVVFEFCVKIVYGPFTFYLALF